MFFHPNTTLENRLNVLPYTIKKAFLSFLLTNSTKEKMYMKIFFGKNSRKEKGNVSTQID